MKQSPPNIFNPEWFPLYHRQFTSLVKTLDNDAIGVYIMLLCHQWDHGYVPTDPKLLNRIVQCKPPVLKQIAPFFTVVEQGKMQFLGLEEIRNEQKKKHDVRLRALEAANAKKAEKKAREEAKKQARQEAKQKAENNNK